MVWRLLLPIGRTNADELVARSDKTRALKVMVVEEEEEIRKKETMRMNFL
jgi:hypothetical protein